MFHPSQVQRAPKYTKTSLNLKGRAQNAMNRHGRHIRIAS